LNHFLAWLRVKIVRDKSVEQIPISGGFSIGLSRRHTSNNRCRRVEATSIQGDPEIALPRGQ